MFFGKSKPVDLVDDEMREGSNKSIVEAARKILDEVEEGEEFFVLIARPEADRRVFGANNIDSDDSLEELQEAAFRIADVVEEKVGRKGCGKCKACLKNK
ncbi:MAG: hypothetical protein WC052_05160 [Patescibacteria group bacterium]